MSHSVPIGLELLKPMVRCLKQTEVGPPESPSREEIAVLSSTAAARTRRPAAASRSPKRPSRPALASRRSSQLKWRKNVRLMIKDANRHGVMAERGEAQRRGIARADKRRDHTVPFRYPFKGYGSRRTAASKNGDPRSRGSLYPSGEFNDNSLRALRGPKGWQCECIFPRTTCRRATA
jgi:hypothetical protein